MKRVRRPILSTWPGCSSLILAKISGFEARCSACRGRYSFRLLSCVVVQRRQPVVIITVVCTALRPCDIAGSALDLQRTALAQDAARSLRLSAASFGHSLRDGRALHARPHNCGLTSSHGATEAYFKRASQNMHARPHPCGQPARPRRAAPHHEQPGRTGELGHRKFRGRHFHFITTSSESLLLAGRSRARGRVRRRRELAGPRAGAHRLTPLPD